MRINVSMIIIIHYKLSVSSHARASLEGYQLSPGNFPAFHLPSNAVCRPVTDADVELCNDGMLGLRLIRRFVTGRFSGVHTDRRVKEVSLKFNRLVSK